MNKDVNTPAGEPSAPVHFDAWDDKGNPIVKAKSEPSKQDSAPAVSEEKSEKPEAKAESAAESGAAKEDKQEKPQKRDKLSAEERIAQLEATIDRIRKDAGIEERVRALESRPKETSEKVSEKKDAPPPTYAEWRKTFKPKDWIEHYIKENPDASYEDAVAAVADYQSDVRDAYRRHEEAGRQAQQKMTEVLKTATEKYKDDAGVEAKIKQTAKDVWSEAPEYVRSFIGDSEVIGDLLYTLSDRTTLNNLLETAKANPGKALRVLRDMELDVQKAVTKDAAKSAEKPEVKTEKKTPVETKPDLPKPPSEVGGRGAVTEDPLVSAAKANDFRAFDAEQTRRFTSQSR